MVACQYQYVLCPGRFDLDGLFPDSIGRSFIPTPAMVRLLGGKNLNPAFGEDVSRISPVNVPVQRNRVELGLLIGISISRYFPARGTAGFVRSRVSGYSRDPTPPPITTAITSFIRMDMLS